MVYRAVRRYYRSGAGPQLRAALSRHQGQRAAHDRASGLSACHPGDQGQRHPVRRPEQHGSRSLRRIESDRRAGKICSRQFQQGARYLQELRSGRLLFRQLRGHDRDWIQHFQSEGSRRAEELDRPARSQMEGQYCAWPSRLQRLCRHLGADDAQSIRLGFLREAGQEQSADRPFDQRHGHDAERRRERHRGLRASRHRARERAEG